MGQQQLILLVLATIIVGLAIVVGIRAFNENNIKSNADAMMQDAVRMANDLQAWKQKPAPFGGQATTQTPAVVADVANYTGAAFGVLGYGTGTDGCAAAEYGNLNGCFTLAIAATATTITGRNARLQNEIQVVVDDITDAGVLGTINCLGNDPASGTCPTTW